MHFENSNNDFEFRDSFLSFVQKNWIDCLQNLVLMITTRLSI